MTTILTSPLGIDLTVCAGLSALYALFIYLALRADDTVLTTIAEEAADLARLGAAAGRRLAAQAPALARLALAAWHSIPRRDGADAGEAS